MKTPRQMNLEVFAILVASHSLVGFEDPHHHEFHVTLNLNLPFPIQKDQEVDLYENQNRLKKILAPLQSVYLNDAFQFQPTCENLCQWIWNEFQKTPDGSLLDSVKVSLSNLRGEVLGAATLQ